MAHKKQASKRGRRSKALPVLGIAGASLSLAGAASASTGGPAVDLPSQNTAPSHQLFLGEEEMSDVSLATFYVYDKENAARPQLGEKVAWWRCGCGGCGRCGCGWRGCAGCGGCHGQSSAWRGIPPVSAVAPWKTVCHRIRLHRSAGPVRRIHRFAQGIRDSCRSCSSSSICSAMR